MSKIRIKNFGPIKEGFQENDGWIDVKKVTLFIGNQGSGKSTVAKLISTMTWIEKALSRGDFNEKDLTVYNRFVKHCSYQNIQNYFHSKTRIEYEGKAYSILYEFGSVTILKNKDNGYHFPKIMYVPSERNFVSAVKNVRSLKGLPSTLYTFFDEFIDAIEELKGNVDLPINNVKFEYQKLNQLSWIIGEDYKIKLSEASSGFQSFVPLFIVTNYLSHSLKKEADSAIKEISIEEEKRIRKEVEKIYSNPNLSEEVKKASLEYLSSQFKYACFINIVEEPEQNLFPSSQRHVLNKLLQFVNMNKENKLVMTTHSPYIINYLTLCVKAESVYNTLDQRKTKANDPESLQINKIVPMSSTVNATDLAIYELDEHDGTIKKLPDYKGLPSDENKLNDSLEDSNELFAQLQEIEKGWR
jgi:predicted ATPase